MVGNLTDCAACISFMVFKGLNGDATHLTSANVEGRSTIRAPPKSGVLRKVVILGFRALGMIL